MVASASPHVANHPWK